ncbi:MAG: hypothetical protein SFW36_13555 [Leptolyngbyaceae cyanobacterium bins.59]|nr:hypothetical protein [Leptolyngbyaceae cyanobacterium bins.59]
MIEPALEMGKGSMFHSTVWRWGRYGLVSLLANSLIWGSALFYLKNTKPIYTSQWALVLPVSTSGVSVNLPEIGQASSSSASGGASATSDPRANYQYIFSSEAVLANAAKRAKLPRQQFSKPRIKLLDNTTLMQLEVTGRTPEEAQKKSYALYDAILSRIDELRKEQIGQRDKPTCATLTSVQKKLEDAQQSLSTYKLSSGLSFPEQLSNLSVNIEQLRRSRAELVAQEQQVRKQFWQLSQDLRLSPQQATDAFVLKADQVYQQNLKDYSEATVILDVLLPKYGPNHPQVVKETNRQTAAELALLQRSQSLLGRSIDPQTLDQLNLNLTGSGRENLLQGVISAHAEYQGLSAQVQALNWELGKMEAQLEELARRQSVMENLKRDEQIAEAVFASTIAKLDLGQGDIFAAYPMLQMAVQPNLPDKPTSPKKGLILTGAFLGSIFSSTGLAILWIRKPWIAKLAKLIS